MYILYILTVCMYAILIHRHIISVYVCVRVCLRVLCVCVCVCAGVYNNNNNNNNNNNKKHFLIYKLLTPLVD